LQYVVKLSTNTSNPAHGRVFSSKYEKQFAKEPQQIPPLGTRVKDDLQYIGFKRNVFLPLVVSTKAPWLLTGPVVDFSFCQSDKDNTTPEIYKSRFLEFCSSYDSYHYLYTDESKLDQKVAAAVVHGLSTKSIRLSGSRYLITRLSILLNYMHCYSH